jgi:hypothetical protein
MIWRRRKAEVPVYEDNLEEARAAHRVADKDHVQARAKDPEIVRVSRSLAEMREQNHLAEELRRALGGK